MTHVNNLTTQPNQSSSLIKPILIGAGIALIVISIFLMGVKHPHPAWGKLWMIKPLIITPLAGASGGVFYYLLKPLRLQGGWKMILGYAISFIGFIIALWLGIVLGLNGTLWN
jgi:hypothetical protein